MFHEQIKLEAVASKNPKKVLKHHRRRATLYWIALGLSFLMMAAGAIVAALTQIWAFFTLTALGLIFLPISAIAATWHSTRGKESKDFKELNSYILSKDFHKISDIAQVIHLDQQGVLFLLRKIKLQGGYANYQLFYDIIFADSSYASKLTPIYIKKNYLKEPGIGKINFYNLKMECPHCHIQIDFASVQCPYCRKEISL